MIDELSELYKTKSEELIANLVSDIKDAILKDLIKTYEVKREDFVEDGITFKLADLLRDAGFNVYYNKFRDVFEISGWCKDEN